MIIVETNSMRTDDKGNSQRAAGHREEGSSSSTTRPSPPPPYTSQTSYQPTTGVILVAYRPSPAQRFWKAFGVAVLIWFLVAAFTNSAVDMAFNHASRHFRTGEPPHPAPQDGTVHHCISGPDWTLSNQGLSHFPNCAESFLEFPVDSDAIYLFTRGSQQSGRIDIVQSTEPTDKVGVHVRVGYHAREMLDHANVCHIERKTNEHGIGILTPASSFPGNGQLRFEVKITLPAGKNGDALHIKAFETDTSNYNQDIADVWNTISFDRLSLKTSNGHISAKSVTVEHGLIRSSNGAIRGHFNSSSSLKLTTSNGPIQTSVSLLNRENGIVSELKMTTSNGKIDASVDLITHSGHGGIFDVETRTSNGPVTLEYTDVPVDSILRSETRSSNAAMSVKLHSTFQGSFDVDTSNAAAMLKELPVEDPSGQGRRRKVTQRRERYRLRGSAYWGESKEIEGHATIKTSNGRVELVI
ncbi:hypothetical protein DEU56DRAFT_773780 [Suillus clintonianus]|uniref:uncharacterized protein n=1 Tax=Suillus clintonianus TaxID=1904413 RepID=UPI001B862F94|nr:uncharacterized protein DEU56DRAFT_773780 [Suillus clintonianus]KAG2153221.1 hypothetical protein DEU56DRAFT_773780 [Suillus clintonianus]